MNNSGITENNGENSAEEAHPWGYSLGFSTPGNNLRLMSKTLLSPLFERF